jgi:hypothetical protein
MEFGFEYVNSSSAKWIYTLLRQISGLTEIVSMTKLAWYYERGDEDMYELGLILRSLVECSFDIVEVNEMNSSQYERIFLGK